MLTEYWVQLGTFTSYIQTIDIVPSTMSHEPWSMKNLFNCVFTFYHITTGKQPQFECNVSVFSGDFRVVKMPLGGDVDTWLGRVATLWENVWYYCNENKLKNMISIVNPLMMGDIFRRFNNNKFTVLLMHSLPTVWFGFRWEGVIEALLNVCCSRYANLCIEF